MDSAFLEIEPHRRRATPRKDSELPLNRAVSIGLVLSARLLCPSMLLRRLYQTCPLLSARLSLRLVASRVPHGGKAVENRTCLDRRVPGSACFAGRAHGQDC